MFRNLSLVLESFTSHSFNKTLNVLKDLHTERTGREPLTHHVNHMKRALGKKIKDHITTTGTEERGAQIETIIPLIKARKEALIELESLRENKPKQPKPSVSALRDLRSKKERKR